MDEAQQKNKLTIKKILELDKLALILGLIVDLITLTSILLAINLSSGDFTIPGFITPGLAFGIWFLAVYSYLAFLHSYWENNRSDKGFAVKFRTFLINDLILEFRNPVFLLPAIVSVITLIWVANYADKSGQLCIGIFLVLGVGILALGPDIREGVRSQFSPVSQEFKQRVEDNWELLEANISGKLSRWQWIGHSDLNDIAVVWEVPIETMKYVLAKYAMEHPAQTAYGKVYSRDREGGFSTDGKVLISLEEFKHDKYFYV